MGYLNKLLLVLLLTSGQAWGNLTINMPVGVTEISRKIYHLHMTIFWICVVIGVLVFGVMFYAIIFHRRSRGHKAAKFHEHLGLEIIWAIIPFIILIVMAVPATKTILAMDDIKGSDLTIKVTGYMWRWHYEYVGTGVAFMSDLATPYEQIINRAEKSPNYLREVNNPLVLPVNRNIRFLMTAGDVIHSWWVPELAIKKDAIPGFINETWTNIDKPGIYRGQCAELCGARHGFMPIVVRAVSQEEFAQWIIEQERIARQGSDAPAHAVTIIENAIPKGRVEQ